MWNNIFRYYANHRKAQSGNTCVQSTSLKLKEYVVNLKLNMQPNFGIMSVRISRSLKWIREHFHSRVINKDQRKDFCQEINQTATFSSKISSSL